jgi:hypothetical protein
MQKHLFHGVSFVHYFGEEFDSETGEGADMDDEIQK